MTELQLLTDKKDLASIFHHIMEVGVFAYDLETDSLNILVANIVGVAISYEYRGEEFAYYIPNAHTDYDKNVDLDFTLRFLKSLCENEDILTVAHNAYYDNGVMRRYGIHVKNFFCTYAVAYLLYGGYSKYDKAQRSRIGLKHLAKRIFDHDMTRFGDLVNYKKGETFAQIDPDVAGLYAADDGLQTLRLYHFLSEEYDLATIRELYPIKEYVFNDEMVLIDALIDMKLRGCPVDVDYQQQLQIFYEEKVEQTKKELLVIADKYLRQAYGEQLESAKTSLSQLEKLGADDYYQQQLVEADDEQRVVNIESVSAKKFYRTELLSRRRQVKEISKLLEFNPNSSPQVGHLLCDIIGIEPVEFTASGKVRTNAECLQIMEEGDTTGIVTALRVAKKYSKALGSCKNLEKYIVDGVIRPDFNAHSVVTGRFSSKEPNFQNQTAYGIGSEMRGIFKAPDGYKLMACDYATQEMRIAFSLSKSTEMVRKINNEGLDVHSLIASMIFSVDVSEVTKTQRNAGKAITFGIFYGLGIKNMAKNIGCSEKRAVELKRMYFAGMPKLLPFIKRIEKFTLTHGFSPTVRGTVRYFPEIHKEAWKDLRECVNGVIQGTAAGQMRRAMALLFPRLQQFGDHAYMIGQVHDEVLLCVKDELVEEVSLIVGECLSNAYIMDIHFEAEISVAPDWYELKHEGKLRPTIDQLRAG